MKTLTATLFLLATAIVCLRASSANGTVDADPTSILQPHTTDSCSQTPEVRGTSESHTSPKNPTMKFMLLKQGTLSASATLMQLAPAEIGAHIQFILDLQEELKRSGELVLAEGLDFPPQAVIVTATKPDAPTISDGPFAETKEFLAGFWIVDVASRERAIAIAAKASTVPGAGGKPMSMPIEVRRVMSAPPID